MVTRKTLFGAVSAAVLAGIASSASAGSVDVSVWNAFSGQGSTPDGFEAVYTDAGTATLNSNTVNVVSLTITLTGTGNIGDYYGNYDGSNALSVFTTFSSGTLSGEFTTHNSGSDPTFDFNKDNIKADGASTNLFDFDIGVNNGSGTQSATFYFAAAGLLSSDFGGFTSPDGLYIAAIHDTSATVDGKPNQSTFYGGTVGGGSTNPVPLPMAFWNGAALLASVGLVSRFRRKFAH